MGVELFIRRPVMTVMVMASILLFGLGAYRQLAVSDLPNVDFPTIMVFASLPGASPEIMASSVATVLEKEFSTISGIDSMSSVSSSGSVRISLQFSLDRDIDAAAQDVQTAISTAARRLPDGMSAPPSFRKINPAADPILYIALSSSALSLSELDRHGQSISQRLSMINGVAQVTLRGTQRYALRIQLNPQALQGLNLDAAEVASAINAQNSKRPLGQLRGEHRTRVIQANTDLTTAAEFREVVVALRNGRPIRLAEVATVADSVEDQESDAWLFTEKGKEQAIFLAVEKQPGSNTIEVADAVRQLLPKLGNTLPASVGMTILRDNSQPIRASAAEIRFTMILTLLLVVLVIFFFTRNLSATLIPSLSLPMSLIGAFAVMYLLGYSLNNMTMMALTLSLGFVVDDAIVVLENIVRHMEMGKHRMQAALDGAREVAFTIVSMTFSLVAIFIPLLLLGGLMGRLFREFSVTIGVAVLVSGVVSLTLAPMLCSRFLMHAKKTGDQGGLSRHSEAAYQGVLAFYDRSLRFVLRHRVATLMLSLLMLGATIWLFMVAPKGFIPSEDRGIIMVSTQIDQGMAYPVLVNHMMELAELVKKEKSVERFMLNTSSSSAMMLLVLKPREARPLSADQLVAKLRPQLNSIPGIRAMPINPPALSVGGRRARSLYQLSLQGLDATELYAAARELEEAMRNLPELVDVSSDLQLENPELHLDIDRPSALLLGVSPRQIEEALYSAYGQRSVSTLLGDSDQYEVIMEYAPAFRGDATALSQIRVRSSQGDLVPLASISQLKEGVGPLSINHSGQSPSVTLSFNVKPQVALGDALKRAQALADANLPSGVQAFFQGNAQQFKDSQASLGILLGLSILVIYIVLGIVYESFIHPFTILSALPFAGFGALATLLAFNTDLSIYAFVGIIMLVGLVKKNGIMMIDFALTAQAEQGKSAAEAIHAACLIRFRPIMMTTMAALMSSLPLALGYGAGAESRQPLGLAVVGGLLFSQSLTLYATPVFYVSLEALRRRLRRAP